MRERLQRSVKRLVTEGLAERGLLSRAPRRRRSDELTVIVKGIALANPEMSLRAIAIQLEHMGLQTPRCNKSWAAASVAHLLGRSPPPSESPPGECQ